VETIVDPGASPEGGGAAPAARPVPTPAAAPASPPSSSEGAPPPSTEAPDWARPDQPGVAPTPAQRPSASAREAIAPTRGAGGAGADAGDPGEPDEPDGGARHDDTDAESSGLDSTQLLQEALGAQVIEEIPHS
jgi:hypothetical protein